MDDHMNYSIGQQPRHDYMVFRMREQVASLRAQLAAVTAQRDELLRSVALWQQWGWHSGTCEFVRQRALNPQLDTALFADYCDCGWHLARLAIARAQPEQLQQPKELDHG